jgi:hypothetical protein
MAHDWIFYFWAFVSTITTGGTGNVPPLVQLELVLYHQCIGGTDMFPQLVTDMQTGSTNNHISPIIFVLAAPTHWWDWLVAPVLMVRYKGECCVSSTSLTPHVNDYSLGWSEQKRKYI